MTEEVNYYEILRGLENLLYKIQCYKPANDHAEGWIATRANELRLEVLQYIFSVSILKNEFIKKVNEYVKKRETPNFKKDIEQFKNKILELYYNDNSVSQQLLANKIENLAHEALTQPLENMQKLVNELSASINVDIELEKTFIAETENLKIYEIDDFLCDCYPEIFYYPKVTTTKNNYQLCESIKMLYGNFNPVLFDYLKTKSLINVPLEYYIITGNYPLCAEDFETLFCESYIMTALWKVINDLYAFIDKQCRKIYTGQTMKLDSISLKLQKLTPQQKKVCLEIVKGESVNNIAITLNCTQSTIREHIRQACLRLPIDGNPGITNLRKYLNDYKITRNDYSNTI